MAIDLNFNSLETAFLCLDQPIVIKTIAMILINGCSKEVNRSEASFIWPNAADPSGDTKYNTNPTNNWVWVPIKANKAISQYTWDEVGSNWYLAIERAKEQKN